MSIHEFKNSLNLIVNFAAKVNEAGVPEDVKIPMIRAYASTLGINLSNKMVENIIGKTDFYAQAHRTSLPIYKVSARYSI